MNGIKIFFKDLYKSYIFRLGSSNAVIYRFYLKLYTPKPNSVEAFMDLISKGNDDFFVFQVGANDGMTHDPLHKFIKRDGWKGILMEPQPYVFNTFLSKVYKKDQGITAINAAIGEKDGEATLFKISFSNERWATGLARFDRTLLEQLIKEGRLDKKIKKSRAKPPENKADWISEEVIAMRSPHSIFRDYNVKTIDLLMIDTEGFDFEVIKLINLDKVLPKAIVFEDMHLSESDYNDCKIMLSKHNYSFKRLGPNTIAWLPELEKKIKHEWLNE